MGENEVASATERAWAADPILHLKVESREMSRHASSIKDETSKINPPREELRAEFKGIEGEFVFGRPGEYTLALGIRIVSNTITDVEQVAVGECTDEIDHVGI